jgi:hypothetical protein
MRKYTIHKKDTGFEVLTPDNKIIQNHLEQDFSPLSEDAAKLLCKDLNEVIAKNEKIDFQSEDEVRESFIYCVMSTLMGIDSNAKYRPIDFRMAIQWDRAFRLMDDPIQSMDEASVINDLVNFLDGEWKNLPLNYGESMDDIEMKGDEKVPEVVIAKLEKVYDKLNNAQQAALHILFSYMDSFSVSMPLLWLDGIVSDEALAKANMIFNEDDEDDEKEYKGFFEKRLNYLKQYLNSFK